MNTRQKSAARRLAGRVYRFVRPFLRALSMPLRAAAAVPVLLIVGLLAPFHRVRFAHVGRINHVGWLAQCPEAYLRQWQLTGKPKGSFLVLMYDPDNQALFDIYRRHMTVISSHPVNWYADFIAPVMAPLGLFVYDHRQYFNYRRYSLTGPSLHLSDAEERRGRAELEAAGIGADDWFVCFHARDADFYHNPDHDYRNCSIENSLPAMQWVTEQGGVAFRMGAKVTTRLPDTGNRRIVDYASTMRTPFLDIFLSARCRYFIGNTAGIICVPVLFNRPMAMANTIPHCTTSMRRVDPFIPKLLRDRAGHILTFAEMDELKLFAPMESSTYYMAELARLGLQAVENTPEELLDLCRDMEDIIQGREPDRETRRLQMLYRDRYQSFLDREWVPLIGPRFAARHADLIDCPVATPRRVMTA